MNIPGYDLPDELTSAEKRLKAIYAEYRALKEETQKKKEAEAAAAKRKSDDVVAEDASSVAKKLKNAGLLTKLQAETTPKTHIFKRAGALERRLHVTPKPEKIEADGLVSTTSIPTGFTKPAQPSLNRPLASGPSRIPGSAPKPGQPPAAAPVTSRRAPRKSLYDTLAGPTESSEAADASTGNSAGYTGPSDYGYSDAPNSGERHLLPNRQEQGLRQKMIHIRADNVDESFLRPIFEKFGPLTRVRCVPHKKEAFILFKLWEHSQAAVRELNGQSVDNVKLFVSPAKWQQSQHQQPQHQRSYDDDDETVRTSSSAPSSARTQDKRELVSYEDGEIL